MGSYGTMDLVTEQGLEDPLIKTIGAVGYYQVSKLTRNYSGLLPECVFWKKKNLPVNGFEV